MALSIIHQYQSRDATSLLNSKLELLVGKGIYDGGLVTYSAGSATCTRAALKAVGYDGVTIVDTASNSITFTTAGTYHIIIRAKYNASGSPSTPTISEETMTAAQYAADPDLSYLMIVATVTVDATPQITAVSYASRDVVDSVTRSNVRGIVATTASLPSPSPTTNRTGDCYFVTGEESWYYWDGTQWLRVVARGAGSRDAAYDDGGLTGGAGRSATVDSQAILDVQSATAQRSMDIGNAVRRIDKTGSTITGGEIGEDIKMGTSSGDENDFAGVLIRSLVVNSAGANDLQANETITISNASPPLLTLTRVGAAMPAALSRTCHLVEVTGTTNSQDGLYLYDRTNNTTGDLINLDGTNPVGIADTGIANFCSIRDKTGCVPGSGSINGSVDTGFAEYAGTLAAAEAHKTVFHHDVNSTYLKSYNDIDNNRTDCTEWLDANGDYAYSIGSASFGGKGGRVATDLNRDAVAAISGVNAHATGIGVEGYATGGGSFVYETNISKYINIDLVPRWTDGGAWAEVLGADGPYWESNGANESLYITSTDWPQGMTLTNIEVDWATDNAANELELRAYKMVWPAASGLARTFSSLFSVSPQVAGGFGARRTDILPSAGVIQNNTQWDHATDTLVLYFSTSAGAAGVSKQVYGVRLVVTYKSVNKWDGLNA